MDESGWVLAIWDVTHERQVQERVQQQQRLAAVGQLAAGIAHDFNNMLTVIMGVSQLVEMDSETPEKHREDLRRIFTQGERAAQLVRQILDFSRKTVARQQPVDLMPFLKEAEKLLARTLPETIRLVSTFDIGKYTVEANLAQLQEVITNLAINARDAMPSGGELKISLSQLRVEVGTPPPLPEMSPGQWIAWTVADTGTGIPSEIVKRIYEPFFTTKDPGEGTGLGLAQVYGIVKQHGGEIDVESVVDRGTIFTIYLPRYMEEETFDEKPDPTIPRGKGEMILVVEDETGVMNVVKKMLNTLNYRVRTASDGQEALAVYDAHGDEIALVLTDMVMPAMNGLELFKKLQKKNPRIRVLIMTGYLAGGNEQPLPSEIAGVIEKPLNMKEVGQIVHQALK